MWIAGHRAGDLPQIAAVLPWIWCWLPHGLLFLWCRLLLLLLMLLLLVLLLLLLLVLLLLLLQMVLH